MKRASDEFIYVRDHIKKSADLLRQGNTAEASFMLGCLHSICHENALQFNSTGASWVYDMIPEEQTI